MSKQPKLYRGKTVKQIAAEFGISIPRVYQHIRRGSIGQLLSGKYIPNEKNKRRLFVNGRSMQEIADDLGIAYQYVLTLRKSGKLKKYMEGWRPDRGATRVNGLTLAQWADKLGLSRWRVTDLHNRGRLMERINGMSGEESSTIKMKSFLEAKAKKTDARLRTIASKQREGETISSLSSRLGASQQITSRAIHKYGRIAHVYSRKQARMTELNYRQCKSPCCANCKHFAVARMRCTNGPFSVTTKYGVCDEHSPVTS